MAVKMFAAIEIGSFALELGIYEISEKTVPFWMIRLNSPVFRAIAL